MFILDLQAATVCNAWNNNIWGIAGLLPAFSGGNQSVLMRRVGEMLDDAHFVGIGVFGLDYTEELSLHRKLQQAKLFKKHVEMAVSRLCPFVFEVTGAGAFEDALSIMHEVRHRSQARIRPVARLLF